MTSTEISDQQSSVHREMVQCQQPQMKEASGEQQSVRKVETSS